MRPVENVDVRIFERQHPHRKEATPCNGHGYEIIHEGEKALPSDAPRWCWLCLALVPMDRVY